MVTQSATLASIDELVQFDMFVEGILASQLLDLALSEPLADGLSLGQLDAHIAEITHLLPAAHQI